MKTIHTGIRTFSIKTSKSFSYERSGSYGFDQEKFIDKYPKAMLALAILKKAQEPNPLKALLAIAQGKREYREQDVERLLRAAQEFLDKGMSSIVKYHSEKKFSTITNEDEFREYAHKVMKNAHGDNYSEELTNKVVDDLIKDNPDSSYGELIGRLTSGLGE